MPQWFRYVLRLAFGLSTFALIAYFVDLREVLSVLGNVDPRWLAAAVLCYAATRVLMAVKWWLLLGGRGESIGFATVQRALLLSDYHGLLFPNSFAIDAIRAVLMRHHPRGWNFAAASIAADRVINLGVAATVALAALLTTLVVAPSIVPPAVSTVVILITISVLAGTLVIGARRPFEHMLVALRFLAAHGRLETIVDRTIATLSQMHGNMRTIFVAPQVMIRALLLAVVLVALRAFWIYLTFHAIGVPVDFHWIVTLSPIITMIALLPVTVLGIGLKDGAFVFFFGSIGVATSAALAASLTTLAVVMGMSLLLGLLATMFGPALDGASAAGERP